MVDGFAVMVTVGAGFADTVTVAVAEAVPPGPVAVAVYVVVVVGVTACVPPLDTSAYVVPSLPVNVTCAAFTAVTMRVDDCPDVIVSGFAVICTVGAGFAVTVTVTVAEAFPPAPEAEAV